MFLSLGVHPKRVYQTEVPLSKAKILPVICNKLETLVTGKYSVDVNELCLYYVSVVYFTFNFLDAGF